MKNIWHFWDFELKFQSQDAVGCGYERNPPLPAVHRKLQQKAWTKNGVPHGRWPKLCCFIEKTPRGIFSDFVVERDLTQLLSLVCGPAARLVWVMEEMILLWKACLCVVEVKTKVTPACNGIVLVGGQCRIHVFSHAVCRKRWQRKARVWFLCVCEWWWTMMGGKTLTWCCGLLQKNQCIDRMIGCYPSPPLLRCNYWGEIAMFLSVIHPCLSVQGQQQWTRPAEPVCCDGAAVQIWLQVWNESWSMFMFMTRV